MAARAHGVLLDDAVVQKGAQHNRMPEKVRGISGEAFAPLKVDSRQGEASGGCTVEYRPYPLQGQSLEQCADVRWKL